MGIKEDSVELTGMDYERKLYELKNGDVVHRYLIEVAPGQWEFGSHCPAFGNGKFIERMPDGTCREYADSADSSFHLV